MTQINKVTIEKIESKSVLYNKPVTIVKYAAPIISNLSNRDIIVNDSSARKEGAEYMKDIMKGRPMSRILELEETVEDLKERIEELEDLVHRVLHGG